MGDFVHREGDSTTGHGCWQPTVPAAYSPTVAANGRRIVRRGDGIVPHTCPDIPETHASRYADWRSVTADGFPVQVIGSPVACGDRAAEGSPDIWIGD